MAGNVVKQNGYAVLSHGLSASGLDSRGYAVLASGGQLNASVAYGLLAIASSASASVSYAVLSDPSTIANSPTYTMFSNNASVLGAPGYVVLAPMFPPYEDLDVSVPFIEERFPECVSFGSSGGPGFKTSVFEFDSGFTADSIEWDRLRARYEVTFENASPEDIEDVENFFYGMRGQAIAFRYKDWSDYQISQQNIFVGDGKTRTFQIFKRYSSGGHTFDRIIKKPVIGTADVRLDGAELIPNGDYFINYSTGEIIFPTPPPIGSLGTIVYLEYDVPVRFAQDTLQIAYNDFRQLDVNSLSLIEVLV